MSSLLLGERGTRDQSSAAVSRYWPNPAGRQPCGEARQIAGREEGPGSEQKTYIFIYVLFFASKVISDPGDNANERQSTYLQEAQMEFWHGMILGLFIGANTGLVMAAVFKGCKRELGQAADPEDWLHMDEAVMEDTPALVSKSPRPVAAASPYSFPHS
jgi:hypothetical protein